MATGIRCPWSAPCGSRRPVAVAKDARSVRVCCVNQDQNSEGEERLVIEEKKTLETPPEFKGYEEKRIQEELVEKHGVSIRRSPPRGAPRLTCGPFDFKIESDGNTPRNKLEEIIWSIDLELPEKKFRKPLWRLKELLPKVEPTRDFIGALKKRGTETGLPALIAEVKKASPSKGVIQPDFDPVLIAKAYEKGGAACISVLTEENFFQGSFENLQAIHESGVQCPLLCKDFIIDAWQVYYARVSGADAVLLIAAVLPDQDLQYFIKVCKVLGLAALVEVHNTIEMDRVLKIPGVQLIGINNRNLQTFEVDNNTTAMLLEGERGKIIREKNILVVGESGLATPEDIAFVQNAGVGAVLVGESLVKQDDPAAGITNLFGKDISRTEIPVGTVQ